jgi:hypothetical protein
MRPVRRVTPEEEQARTEEFAKGMYFYKVNPVEPEPVGTVVLMAFRVTGYDRDCDGSLMARLEQIDKAGEPTGWEPTHLGLYPDVDLVCSVEEFRALFEVLP